MTRNSQLLTTEPMKTKRREKQDKQTTRTGRQSQQWRSYGGWLAGLG